MTTLDFDELHRLVDASLRTEDLDGVIATVRKLLQGAYEQAVLDWETEFEYIFMHYPEMLDKAIKKPTEGLTWEDRIRSWYHGENPNKSANLGAEEQQRETRTPKPTQGGEIPSVTGEINTDAIQRVVETEYHRMYNTGAYDTATDYQQTTGTTVYKRWATMLDDKVRSTHMYLEGDLQPLDRAFFTYDGDSAMFPGGFILPENNVNCRCTLEYETA